MNHRYALVTSFFSKIKYFSFYGAKSYKWRDSLLQKHCLWICASSLISQLLKVRFIWLLFLIVAIGHRFALVTSFFSKIKYFYPMEVKTTEKSKYSEWLIISPINMLYLSIESSNFKMEGTNKLPLIRAIIFSPKKKSFKMCFFVTHLKNSVD